MAVKGDRAIWEAESEGIALRNITIGALLDQQATNLPDNEALIYNYPEIGLDMRLTYRQYRAEVNKLAKGLLALGIAKGEHIAVWATNVPEWILLQMALAKIGAVMVTVNTAYRASEIEYILKQGDISTLFMQEEVRGNSYLELVYSIVPELKQIADPQNETLHNSNLPRLKRVILLGDKPQAGLMLHSQVVATGREHFRPGTTRATSQRHASGCRYDYVHQWHHGLSQRCDADSFQHHQYHSRSRTRYGLFA